LGSSQAARLGESASDETGKAQSFVSPVVYLLLSQKDKKSYLGSTDNLEKRLDEHNSGKCKSTKNRRPLRLIYKEEFDNLQEARTREKYLKSRKGRSELKYIFKNLGIGE
jgi:putative endonuclease